MRPAARTRAQEWCMRLGIPVTVRALTIFNYLESRGFRFMVDFGTDNAVDVARADWESRKPGGGRRRKQVTR